MSDAYPIAVLASGSGTNLQAILDRLHCKGTVEVVGVASDKGDALALERAARAGVAARAFPLADHPDRAARDLAMADWLDARGVKLVVLAGYMALLTPAFLERFPARVINVHPSLLPAFPGVRAVEQAFDYGVKVFGVTVHFVDEGIDSGPVILQAAIELPNPDSAEAVLAELHAIEHRLLPRAIELIAAGRVSLSRESPRRVVVGE